MASKLNRLIENIIGYSKSIFWKRDSSILVFGAWFGTKFADNSRFLFQYLSQNKQKYKLSHVVWITKKETVRDQLSQLGYEVYLENSEDAIYYLKHSYLHMICNNYEDNGYGTDIPCKYSYGAKKVNLWHGVGVVKGVGAMSKPRRDFRKNHPIKSKVSAAVTGNVLYRTFLGAIGGWKNCYYLVPSELGHRQLKEMFHIADNRFIHTGQPRSCECPKLMPNEELVIKKMASYKKVILYLPTFRTNKASGDYSKISEYLKEYIEKEDILWIEKPHDADRNNFEHLNSNNIITLNSEFDINTIIPYISIMITDYSSVISDGRFWRKPVLLYIPDYKEYFEGDNGLIEDSELLMSGPKYTDPEQLLKGIINTFSDSDYAFTEGFESIAFEELRQLVLGYDKSYEEIWNDIQVAIK